MTTTLANKQIKLIIKIKQLLKINYLSKISNSMCYI